MRVQVNRLEIIPVLEQTHRSVHPLSSLVGFFENLMRLCK